MAKVTRVELPWLGLSQATEFFLAVRWRLTQRSHDHESIDNLEHLAVSEALNAQKLSNSRYGVRVDMLSPEHLRLGLEPLRTHSGSDTSVLGQALKANQMVEILYEAERGFPRRRSVQPLEMLDWGFKGLTLHGRRNFRWERLKELVWVPRPFTTAQYVLEIHSGEFLKIKRFKIRLLKEDGEKITEESVSSYDSLTGWKI